MALSKQELERLQKLACIRLSSEEQKVLGNQLQDIIVFLNKLQEVQLDKDLGISKSIEHSLRTLGGVEKFDDAKALLQNVKHEKINNSIVIKSVLS